MAQRPQGLYLGEKSDPATHQRTGEAVGIDPADLTTHGVIVGMTGSGKTGLGMVLLEEALSQGVPTLILDPKGDMGNLLLTFPQLAPQDFAPWVPQGTDPAQVATSWQQGLADWAIAPPEISTLRTGHQLSVYTPGSTAGLPLNVIGSLAPPSTKDAESIRDEVEALVQGLLGLVGVTSDPLSGREHVLIANLIETAWNAGETIDLATLLIRIQDPPMRKLGVIDIETFFPKSDRTELMMKLNGLLASPSFAEWGVGAPLDIESLLWTPDGGARAAVIYLAHLSDEERQMVVTRVLSKLVGWMRGQSGSTKLRVLVYMDEVYGFVPPSATPPAKKPLLTLYKQARAFGVGVILATQNPVDLDYKAISNAGTWMIGRLQTERDKARLLDGMSSAAGTIDVTATDATISGLAKREFLLHTAGGKHFTFNVRWAMSYLCGPLSKDQIKALPGMTEQLAITPASPPNTPASDAQPTEASPTNLVDPAGTALAPPTPVAAASPAPTGTIADDESPAMPSVADGIVVRYLDPAAPWSSTVGATSGGRRLQAAVMVRCNLTFDETKADLRHSEVWEAVIFPLSENPTASDAVNVDYDDRDLTETQPAGAVFVFPQAPIKNKSLFTALESGIKDRLTSERSMTISINRELKLFSRPGEAETDFAARCTAAANEQADADANKIRQQLSTKIDRIKEQLTLAQQRADQLNEEASMSKTSEMISVGGSVLGAIFGGRKSVSSIAGAVTRAASGRSRSQRVSNRMEQALARVDEKSANIEDLENQLNDEINNIATHWNDVAAEIETLDIALEKSDIVVEQIALVWVPTA